GNNQIRIYDNEKFDDPRYLETQIRESYKFPKVNLPSAVMEAMARGIKVSVVAEAPNNMNIDHMFYFDKGKPEFRIVDGGQQLEFRAFPKVNFVYSQVYSYYDYVPNFAKIIPFAQPPYGKNVYSIWTRNGESLGMASGFFDPTDDRKLGPEGTIHPSQIANSSGHLKPGFKVKVGDQMYNSADVSIGHGTFQDAGAVGIHFEYPITLKFYTVQDDLSAQFETIPTAAPVGEDTVVGVRVNSTFKQDVNTTYSWNITNNDTGQVIQNIRYQGDSNTESGRISIPTNEEKIFYATFPMPDSKVTVTFRINNPAGTDPQEIILTNNVATAEIRKGTGYNLPYDVLSRNIKHPLIQGHNITAQLHLPEGSWDGNATGNLNVNQAQSPEVLSNYLVENNPPVNEPSDYIVRKPVISATIDRASVGDNLLGRNWLNRPQPLLPIVRNPSIAYNGAVSRPYFYYCDSEYCDGHSGTATASFNNGTDILGVKIYSYNGKPPDYMPPVAAREFRKTVDNNNYSQSTRNLFWESDPYDLDVIRWMHRLDENGAKYDSREVLGQYRRTFTQQDSAVITMEREESMDEAYRVDRNNARRAKNGKNDYPRVPFATDKQLQNKDYPFKSGYYFNPAGEYKFTIKTVLYKDTPNPTREHAELVEKVIDAFRYESSLRYTVDGRNHFPLKWTADDNDYNNTSMLRIEKDYDIHTYELPHTTNPTGETDRFFKEIMEGYTESNTQNSYTNYKYREYIKGGQEIHRVTEETKVTINVNPSNQKLYTFANMKNGEYPIRVMLEDFTLRNYGNRGLTVRGKNAANPLDDITVTVKGSMYDDLNN
nr:hypothetical protein [Clostridia bacterium]